MFGKKNNELTGGLDSFENTESLADKVGDTTVESGKPSVGEQTKKKNNVKTVFIMLAVAVALLVFIASAIAMLGGDDDAAKNAKKDAEQEMIENHHQRNLDLQANVGSDIAEFQKRQQQAKAQAQEAQKPKVSALPTAQATPAQAPPPNPKLQGSVLMKMDGGHSNSDNQADSSGKKQDDRGAGSSYGDNRLSKSLAPTITIPTVAHRREDLTFLLRKGTTIGCTLNTKIVTTHPGLTRCLVTKDVYSADGKVLLIERGSEVIGEQRSALLQGEARVFVLWTEIETPHGVTMTIDSPSADSLGASGQEAQVDSHWWQRFGGAIMLSMITDVMEVAKEKASNSGGDNNITYDNTSDTIQDMASEALKNTINIPPTGYVNQGTLVNVMVARDVDFRSVYEVVKPIFTPYSY